MSTFTISPVRTTVASSTNTIFKCFSVSSNEFEWSVVISEDGRNIVMLDCYSSKKFTSFNDALNSGLSFMPELLLVSKSVIGLA
jgi:hypothetical protein